MFVRGGYFSSSPFFTFLVFVGIIFLNMNKKTVSILVIAPVAILGVVVWSFFRGDEPTQSPVPDGVNQTETEVISVDKPASFEGVEMVTYKSPYGYEITYPSAWILKDVTDVFYKKVLNGIDIEPIEVVPYSDIDYLILISVENGSLSELKEQINSGDQLVRNIKNMSELEQVSLNGLLGLRKLLRDPSAYYFFEKNGKLYTINFFYDVSLKISKQEALWVLSTFKITE